MVPIFEKGQGRGIGYGLETFLQRFDQICAEHLAHERAKAFAFIFYDFLDEDLKQILKDQGVFTHLDRLSGDQLSIFCLHTDAEVAVRRFNREFLSRLSLNETTQLPCAVFFRLGVQGVTDVAVAQLDSADLMHGVLELYGVIQRYLEGAQEPESGRKHIRWMKSAAGTVTMEALRAALRAAFDHLTF